MSSTLRLIWKLDGETHRREFEDGPITIGRGHACSVVINHGTVSRRHAELRLDESGWTVEDLGSHNHTYVNGARVERHRLAHGDLLRLGTDIAVECEISGERGTRVEFLDGDSSVTGALPMSDVAGRLHRGSTVNLHAGSSSACAGNEDFESVSLLHLFEQAARILHSSSSLESLLEQVLGFVFAAIPAERGCVFLLENDLLVTHVARLREGSSVSGRIQISETVSRLAIERREGILVADALHDDRTHDAGSVHDMRIRSAMCAPLIHEDDVAGLVYVDTRSMTDRFTERELEILSILTLISSAAIVQTRLREQRERARKERERLEHYLPAAVVDELIAQGSEAETLEPRDVEISALFADLVGFTSLCEERPAHDVFEILNALYGRLTEAVFEHGGTLAKYNGDELVVFFGAPRPQTDHPIRAVGAALAILDELEKFNGLEYCPPLQIRIGIDSGVAAVGDLGTHSRREYSAIGHVVNAAKRLQSSVAEPGQIVIGSRTHDACQEHFRAEQLPEVRLKGFARPVRPWRVIG